MMFKKFKSNKTYLRRFIALLAMLSILITQVHLPPVPVQAGTGTVDVGPTEHMKDGAILHAWCWSFNTIKNNMADIANAGYTSIQTSPINNVVVGNGGNLRFTDQWWYHYQPTDYKIGNYQLGSEAEFKAMCDEAHRYGIRIIVDAVVNHMTSDYSKISQEVKNINGFLRTNESIGDHEWGNRHAVTQKALLGLWDLNTHNPAVHNYVRNYLVRCVELGADGFRYDAAKHIELPDDGNFGSNFWPAVLNNGAEFQYGEILQDGISRDGAYANYMSVTASNYGKKIRDNMGNNNFNASTMMNYDSSVNPDKLVTWVESHDTYANGIDDWGSSQWMNDEQLKLAWAIIGARAEGTPLFFSRPVGGGGKSGDSRFPEITKIGDRGSDLFMDDEVVAVNKFRNAMDGKSEYLRNPNGNNQVLMIERGREGIVIINGSHSNTNLSSQTNLANGTYTNRTDDNSKFTVSNGTITGTLPSRSVVVLYDGEDSQNPIDPIDPIDPIEPGDPIEKGNLTFSFEKPSNWGTNINAYIYDEAGVGQELAAWPGVSMTNKGNNLYTYSFDNNYSKPLVIFNDGYGGIQAPAQDERGFELLNGGVYNASGLVRMTGRLIVKYVDESGKEIKASTVNMGTVGNPYTTVPAEIEGYTLKQTPGNASGKYTKEDITVTYVYTEDAANQDPLVTSSLAKDSTFKTETQTITLSLKNAVSGTYSVDNGPEKTFTNTASVVLGQGKVADSVVTVETTAKGEDGTVKAYTFTYNKEFNGTVNEENDIQGFSSFNSGLLSNSQGLASQYSTNANGFGVKKTINIDGSLSGWDKSMLIAQGAANDDPRVYRDNSMYEVPIDLYALYGAYDDTNLYLMWEMTNVQDVVAPNDDYPLSQGVLFQTMNVPFYIAIDTGNSSTAIGNSGKLSTGEGTLWGSKITFERSFNKIIAVSTNGANGPYLYGGSSAGINPVEEYKPAESGIQFDFGLGILSDKVMGINEGYGYYNGRIPGDMTNNSADWVNFNTLGHNTSEMDFHYEMAIPLDKLGVTSADIQSDGLGVLLIATMGLSGMDCLPYDLTMNDNADLADTESQEFNSYEKSDEDHVTTAFARIGKGGGGTIPDPNPDPEPDPETMELNFGAELSSPQVTGTELKLQGIAEGGTGPYTYKYYVNGDLLDTKTSASSSETLWTPLTAGSYMIKSVVTDSGGESVTSSKAYVIEGTSIIEDLTLTAAASASSIKEGEKVTITGTAKGGTGGYTYKFTLLNKETNQYTVLADFNSSNKFTWTANAIGSMAFIVEVKDDAGSVVESKQVPVTVTKPGTTVRVTGISLDKTTLALKVAETRSLITTVTPSNASNKSVTWSSSNKQVATVDASGKITSLQAGTATITAKTVDGGYTASCIVTVTQGVTGVYLDKTSIQLEAGSASNLYATVTPSNASNKSVTWSSSNNQVATVDGSGKVIGLKAGTAIITVTTADGGYKATSTIFVSQPTTGVSIDKSSAKLGLGETINLRATVSPSDASNKAVVWSSSDESVAIVDASGKVTAIKAGTATITVRTEDGNYTALCRITVSQEESNPDPKPVTFTDVGENHWAYKQIQDLSARGIINGYADGTFRPGDNLTRAQAIVMLVNALGLDVEGKTTDFTDVPEKYWAAKHIGAAQEAGITSGFKDGTFKPGENITRGQIAVMIANAFEFTQEGGYKNFTDVPQKHWAYKQIEILASNGVISGYKDGSFAPGDLTTRAHFSVMLYNAINK